MSVTPPLSLEEGRRRRRSKRGETRAVWTVRGKKVKKEGSAPPPFRREKEGNTSQKRKKNHFDKIK